MKFFVTGANGQLGRDVMNELYERGLEAIGSGSRPCCEIGAARVMPYVQLDISDAEAVGKTLDRLRPDVVVHCAAWTAVDAAEEDENLDRVWAVNAQGTGNIAEGCRRLGCKLIYISTDYVFDGGGETPRRPEEQDFSPLNMYGKSKLAGEQAVRELAEKYFIVRTAWVFGLNGGNFVKTMLRLAERGEPIRVVNDQMGRPTYTKDLARLLADMALTEKYGCYHATNQGGYISWYDFACEIFRQAGKNVDVLPVSSRDYGVSRAARPLNSRLDCGKLAEAGFALLPNWRDALARYLKEIENGA